jgi:hypothetical protein
MMVSSISQIATISTNRMASIRRRRPSLLGR